MQFHDYTTAWQINRPGLPRDTSATKFYREARRMVRDNVLACQFDAEAIWIAERRPYYSVWPSIIPSLLRLHLDLDAGLIRLPLPQLLVRFAVGHEPEIEGQEVRQILAGMGPATNGVNGLSLLVDFGDKADDGTSTNAYIGLPLLVGQSLEHCLSPEYHDMRCAQPAVTRKLSLVGCVRLVCTLCLLANDPDLIEPEPLADDQQKYDDNPDQRLIDKALHRGKRGWRVGARLQADPHYRRPHVALRWTGEGRKIPRIVPVKGSIVHRRRMAEMPTGYMDDERCKLCGQQFATAGQDTCAACEERMNKAIVRPTSSVQRFGFDRHRSGHGRGKIGS